MGVRCDSCEKAKDRQKSSAANAAFQRGIGEVLQSKFLRVVLTLTAGYLGHHKK